MNLLFDHFIAIDWSGAEKPLQNPAIALAHYKKHQKTPEAVLEKLSRQAVFDYLCQCVDGNQINLVGIDANLGYAHVMSQQLYGENITPQALWDKVDKLCKACPNFFAGAVWTHKNLMDFYWTKGPEPEHWLAKHHRRLTETACGEQGLGYPENPFKLMGTKQVGKGGLAAMRLLHQLKIKYADKVCIWPFEQPTHNTSMVIMEIYPRLFLKQVGFGNKKIRCPSELKQALAKFKAHYLSSTLAVSDHVADAVISAAAMRTLANNRDIWPNLPPIAQSEGWIFGVKS